MVGNQYPKDLRLRHTREFRHLRAHGTKRHTPHFVVYFFQKPDGPTRLGITVSRKVGGAVTRNRIKRLVREVFRKKYREFPDHTDFSIIAKKTAGRISYDQVARELTRLTSSKTSPNP